MTGWLVESAGAVGRGMLVALVVVALAAMVAEGYARAKRREETRKNVGRWTP